MKTIQIAALVALIARSTEFISARSQGSTTEDNSMQPMPTGSDERAEGTSGSEAASRDAATQEREAENESHGSIEEGSSRTRSSKHTTEQGASPFRSTSLLNSAENWAKWAESVERSSLASLGLYAPQAINMYVVLVSLITVAPFAYFTFAGHSAPLHDYYKSFGLSFGSQAVTLSLLDGMGLPDFLSILGAVLVAGLVAYRCQTGCCEHCPCMMDLYFGAIVITTVLLVVSPFVVMQSQLMFWVIVLGLAWLLQFAYPKIPMPVAQLDGIKVATVSAFGFVSGLCVLATLFGYGGSFDFFSYFAVPSTFAFNQTDTLYLLIFLTASGVGAYINGVRDPKITA